MNSIARWFVLLAINCDIPVIVAIFVSEGSSNNYSNPFGSPHFAPNPYRSLFPNSQSRDQSHSGAPETVVKSNWQPSPSSGNYHQSGFQHQPIDQPRRHFPVPMEYPRSFQYVGLGVQRGTPTGSLTENRKDHGHPPKIMVKDDRLVENHRSVSWETGSEPSVARVKENVIVPPRGTWQRNAVSSAGIELRRPRILTSHVIDTAALSRHRLDEEEAIATKVEPEFFHETPISREVSKENIRPIVEPEESARRYYATSYGYHISNPETSTIMANPMKYMSLWNHPETCTDALERLLLEANFKPDSYSRNHNSEEHPPPNPILALILSNYGQYLPGPLNPRPYAHTAVNNIHNTKPFGNYKLTLE